MGGKCSHPSCPDPDNIGCNVEGHIKLSDCKHYKEKTKTEENHQIEDDYYRIPWTGVVLRIIFTQLIKLY